MGFPSPFSLFMTNSYKGLAKYFPWGCCHATGKRCYDAHGTLLLQEESRHSNFS